MDTEIFGVFSPIMGLKRDFPNVLISKVFHTDNENVLIKDGEVHRRQMRSPDLLDGSSDKVQTPDGNPILHYHRFVKRSTGTEYLLAFTKAHIYHWNVSNKAFDTKFVCKSDCTNWETVSYNDKIVATNDSDMVLVWDTTGYFIPLQNTSATTITAATKADPCQVTAVEHGLTTGDRVFIKNVGGMTEINNLQFVVTVVDSDNFTLGVDSTGYTTYTSGGTVLEFEGIEYSRSYSNETNVDLTSASGQKVLSVDDTTGYSADDKIIINRGGDREEEGIVDSVSAGISLTLLSNLIYEHTANAETEVDADSAAEQKVLGVTSTTNFAVGEFVYINTNGERAEVKKIASIQAGVSLTMTVNLFYAHTQAQGDAVVGSGAQQDVVEEYVSYFLTKAKILIVFENYLFLGYLYENGVYYPQRVRWCDLGDETNWLSGNSASAEVGKSDFLMGFGKYRGFLIIFKEKSYFRMWLVATTLIFNMLQISYEIGCESSHSIVNDAKGRLYWFASDKTFREMATGIISGAIQTDIVDKIFEESYDLIKGVFIGETGEVIWSIPFDNALNNKLIAFKEGKWINIDMAVTAFGNYREP